MNFPSDQVEELRPLCATMAAHQEGGVDYLLMESLLLPEGCKPARTDALLCVAPRDGYPSRLFLADRISDRGTPNWTADVRVLERNWHAFSWTVDSPGLRLLQVVMNHLRIFRS